MSVKTNVGEKWAQVTFKRPTKTKDYFISNFGRSKSIDKETEEEKRLKTKYPELYQLAKEFWESPAGLKAIKDSRHDMD